MNDQQINSADMKLRTLVIILFGTICAGCFGMETMVGISGPGLSILGIIGVPIIWSVPIALLCAELGTAIPEQGGSIKWAERALGPAFGFIMGFWKTWLLYTGGATVLVLAMGYIKDTFKLDQKGTIIVTIAILLICAWINIRGLDMVAFSSTAFSVIILIPFVALVAIGLTKLHYNPVTPFVNPNQSLGSNIGYMFALGVWMYSGWEAPASYAGEIKNFKSIFPKAMAITMIIMVTIYLLPIAVGLSVVGDWQLWGVDSNNAITLVEIAKVVGGPVLGMTMLAAAVFANILLYSDGIATASRQPYAMAKDNLFPKMFTILHPKYKTPIIGIIVQSIVAFIASFASFDTLVQFSISLFFGCNLLMMISGIVLRFKEPDLQRPFRVPLSNTGLIIISIPMFLMCIYSLLTNGNACIIGAVVFLLGTPLIYVIMKKIYGGPQKLEENIIR